ncbi:SHOCT domain-containing protein [Halopiger djelfimassiliensis]|uniref:SHOCT domain-containing protein n=1 Tax=Halopiger djelfimassiliensis TaxID=1293047 RepID=UPI000677F2FD|nr:SHOCT domain-containing protein [Halopiger djelfimassiliensis]
MALLGNKWLWLSVLGVFLSGGLILVAVGYLGLLVYSGLVSETPIVTLLLDIAIPVVVGIAVLVALLAVSCVGLLWVLVRNASLPRNDRIATIAERLEREYPPLRSVGLSELFTPPEPSAEEQAERALAELKQQYVDGEITEREFERKVDRLVANDSIDEARAAHERNRMLDDRPNQD